MKITIKGNEYPSRVTLGALVRFKQETGFDVSQLKDDISDVAMFMYCCVVSASSADGVPFNVEFLDFADNVSVEDLTKFKAAQQGDSKKKTITGNR